MTRDPVNAFASCPAATGEASCPQFPDGAHRCGSDRGHVRDETMTTAERIAHRCTCGNVWTSLSGTLANQMVIPDRSTYVHISSADDSEFARGVRVALDEVRRKRS
jgi:hypothetical protein